jgi:hypothetical protein
MTIVTEQKPKTCSGITNVMAQDKRSTEKHVFVWDGRILKREIMDIYDVHTLNPIPTLKSVNLLAGNLYEKTHEALDSHLQIVQGMLTINAISKSMSNLNGWKQENEDLTNTETDSDSY